MPEGILEELVGSVRALESRLGQEDRTIAVSLDDEAAKLLGDRVHEATTDVLRRMSEAWALLGQGRRSVLSSWFVKRRASA